MRLPVVLLACAAALVAAPVALAQPKKPPSKVDPRLAEAKRLFEEGAAAYATGSYDQAIKSWEKSYEISQKPLIFESIANAWERLGDARKARENLARWRDSAPPRSATCSTPASRTSTPASRARMKPPAKPPTRRPPATPPTPATAPRPTPPASGRGSRGPSSAAWAAWR